MNRAAVVLIGGAAIAAALFGPELMAQGIKRQLQQINGLPFRVRCVVAWRVLRAKI